MPSLNERCPNCQSYQTSKLVRRSGSRATVYLHCKACRSDLDIYEGNIGQVKAYRKRVRANKAWRNK